MTFLYRFTLAAILALSLTFFMGCSDDDDDDNPTGPSGPTFFEEVAQNGDDYFTDGTKNISGEALWADIQAADEELFMIDFRSADHYANLGHIEGAVNWTIGELPDNVGQIPSGAKVICICYSGQTASHATAYLRMMGYDAYNLLFGMCGWTTDTNVNLGKWADLTQVNVATETTPHTLTDEFDFPSMDGSSVSDATHDACNTFFDGGLHYMSASALNDLLTNGDDSDDPFLLNYWSEASYNAGHIEGSFRFQPGELGPDELLKYVPTDRQVVVWCYTGQTSAQVSTYLNMLGYDAYSLAYGMNGIDLNLCGTHVYNPPSTDYPVVTGTSD